MAAAGMVRTVFSDFQQQAGIHELVWPQRIVLVVEYGFEFAGAGGLVDLIVDGQQLSREPVWFDYRGCNASTSSVPFPICRDHGLQVVFRQGEENGDGLELGDHEHGIGVGGMNDVAGINQPQTNASGDRRRDMAINEIQLGIVDRGLVVADGSFELVDRGLLRIHLLLGHGARTLQQSLETLVVQLGIAQ